jgi:DNA (cytosine-5)-methyltransferase 1
MENFSDLRKRAGLSVEDVAKFTQRSVRTVYRWENNSAEANALVHKLLSDLIKAKKPNSNPSIFKFIDLFAGIGGLRKGFESIGGECVFTSEWDKFSQLTYQANFRDEHAIAGDITKIEASEIPEHDILLAGFPCQPFSLAGVSKKNSLGREHGFKCETQGTLFFDVARIIEHHQPKAFLLENVKNLKSHDKGRTFEVIKKTLTEELGYHIDYIVLDAKGFVPQHRERIFIVGFKDDVGFKFSDHSFPKAADGPKLDSILHNDKDMEEDPYVVIDETTGKAKPNDKYTLSDKLWSYLQAYAEKHRLKGNGFGYGLVGPENTARTLSARYHKDGSEILIKQEGTRPRRLTPRECARLMGFDSERKGEFIIPVSDTQAYRQFGNSVVVPVVKKIAKVMQPYILSQLVENKSIHREQSAV